MHERPIRRIAIIGSSGAGKSTLSLMLGEVTGLPVIHLDKEYWLSGWVEPERAAWQARLAELAARPDWIIDGQYGASLTERLARADLAIFLDLPTRICLWRVVKRWWQLRGRVRPDMSEGCPEKIDLEFLHYVATFRLLQRPRIVAALEASGVRTAWLRTIREQRAFGGILREQGLNAAMEAAPAWPQPSGFSSTTM